MKKQDKVILSEIRINPIPISKKGIVAFVSFVLNDNYHVNEVMIATSPKRQDFRVVYPLKTGQTGATIQIFYPINKTIGQQIEQQVLDYYKDFLSKINKDDYHGQR